MGPIGHVRPVGRVGPVGRVVLFGRVGPFGRVELCDYVSTLESFAHVGPFGRVGPCRVVWLCFHLKVVWPCGTGWSFDLPIGCSSC